MNEKLIYSGAGLALMAVAFVMFTLISNTLFSGVRLDLTENNLYTLSPGTHEIIDSIDAVSYTHLTLPTNREV